MLKEPNYNCLEKAVVVKAKKTKIDSSSKVVKHVTIIETQDNKKLKKFGKTPQKSTKN